MDLEGDGFCDGKWSIVDYEKLEDSEVANDSFYLLKSVLKTVGSGLNFNVETILKRQSTQWNLQDKKSKLTVDAQGTWTMLMIGSLMYFTSSRPDIMFAVCACARYQVNPKVSHLHAVKRIFRYLKGQLKLGLWYPKDSPFDLVAYIDSDYAGASLDRKSTTGGCQFLKSRLISW
ncbi:hypothetical protein Tco_0488964 [Tanacetum coccineum]